VEQGIWELQEGAGGGCNAEGETSITTTQKILNSKTLTTLILSTFKDKTREKIDNCIKNSPNIICLAGTECHIPGQDCDQQHCKSILANQQAWKEAQHNSSFEYRVGFEGRNWRNVDAKGDHIRLYNTGRCFALFHCPSPGQLKITLNVRRRSKTLEFKATLLSAVDGSKGREPVTYRLPVRQKKGELELVTLSFFNVPKGTGSISVKETTEYSWKIHGLVKLEWAPSTNMEGNQDVKEDNQSPQFGFSAENRSGANKEENGAGTGSEVVVETSTVQ
jgi:hypothetical protein